MAADLPIEQPSVAGDTITVPGASWATAAWLIAHADQYGIDQVRHDGQVWTRKKGWHQGAAPSDSVQAVMASLP
jgi:hypothetical protein